MDRIRACGACDRGSNPLEGTRTVKKIADALGVSLDVLRLKFLNYKTPTQFLKDNKNITLQRSVI